MKGSAEQSRWPAFHLPCSTFHVEGIAQLSGLNALSSSQPTWQQPCIPRSPLAPTVCRVGSIYSA